MIRLGRVALAALALALSAVVGWPSSTASAAIGEFSAVAQSAPSEVSHSSELQPVDAAVALREASVARGVGRAERPRHVYDHRPDFARPPPVEAALHAYDAPTEHVAPAADSGWVLRASSGSEEEGVAPRPTTGLETRGIRPAPGTRVRP